MREFVDKVLKMGADKGFSVGEVYYSSAKSVSVSVFRGEVEKYNTSETGGLSYRGIVDGKMGYSYTELIDDSVVPELVSNAYESAKAVESEDEVFIFRDKCDYVTLNNYNEELSQIPMDKKIQAALTLERKVKEADERVMDVLMCTYLESDMHTVICNSYGIDLEDKRNYCGIYAGVSLRDGDSVRTYFDGAIVKSFGEIDIDAIAKRIIDGAVAQIGAKSTASRSTKVVIKYDAFASLLGVHMGMIEGESVQKGLSPLKEKLGEVIGVSNLNIVDDPHREDSAQSSAFDAEGFPTSKKHIVENGVLKTFLHNMKTAKKAGVESTGNAARSSYKGSVGIGAHNIVVEGGDLSYEELIQKCGEGILITNLDGLHAGVNPVSGDFSLMSSGFEIKEGKIAGPVTQIVLSGNFYTMLKDIEAFGSDVQSSLMAHNYFTPSVLIREMTVSGE